MVNGELKIFKGTIAEIIWEANFSKDSKKVVHITGCIHCMATKKESEVMVSYMHRLSSKEICMCVLCSFWRKITRKLKNRTVN